VQNERKVLASKMGVVFLVVVPTEKYEKTLKAGEDFYKIVIEICVLF
jgi:hypothetical protein